MSPTVREIRENALADIADAEKRRTEAAITLIIAELSDEIEQRRPYEAEAAKALEDSISALADPEERLSLAKHDVSECLVKAAHFAELAEDPDLDSRVDAKIRHAHYLDELAGLRVRGGRTPRPPCAGGTESCRPCGQPSPLAPRAAPMSRACHR